MCMWCVSVHVVCVICARGVDSCHSAYVVVVCAGLMKAFCSASVLEYVCTRYTPPLVREWSKYGSGSRRVGGEEMGGGGRL